MTLVFLLVFLAFANHVFERPGPNGVGNAGCFLFPTPQSGTNRSAVPLLTLGGFELESSARYGNIPEGDAFEAFGDLGGESDVAHA